MSQSISKKRPWLAAVLAVLATGLGHIYLRRWRRALGWLLLVVGVTVVFVDQSAIDALLAGQAVDRTAFVPAFVVGSLSVVDAYLLARAHNVVARLATTSSQLTRCPDCGKELDTDLDFCQWCSAELPAAPAHREE